MSSHDVPQRGPRSARKLIGVGLWYAFLACLLYLVIWPFLYSTVHPTMPHRIPSMISAIKTLLSRHWWVVLLPASLLFMLGPRKFLSWTVDIVVGYGALWAFIEVLWLWIPRIITGPGFNSVAIVENLHDGKWAEVGTLVRQGFAGGNASMLTNQYCDTASWVPMFCSVPFAVETADLSAAFTLLLLLFIPIGRSLQNGWLDANLLEAAFAGATGAFFGSTKKTSGIHGRAQLATAQMIVAAGLTGRAWGEGFRLCEDSAGNIMRYCGKKDGRPQPNSIAIIGPPRCGKLATLASALVVENQGSMVIIDPRAEMLCITLRTRKKLGPVKIICPMREGMDAGVLEVIDRHFTGTGRHTDSYNILDTLNPDSKSLASGCDAIAATVIAEEPDGKNKHFTDGARDIVSGVIMGLKLYHPQEDQHLARVCEIIGTDEVFDFAREAVKLAKSSGGNKYLEMRLAEFNQEGAAGDKAVKESWRTAKRQLRFMATEEMKDALKAPSEPWRFNDAKTGERPMTIYLVNPPDKAEEMAQFNRLLLSTLTKEVIGTPKQSQHLTVLADEFPLLGRMPELQPIFTMGGGAGVSLIVIAQAVSQMTAIWGQHGWDAMQNGLDLTLYFPTQDQQTVAEIVRRGGQETVVTQSYSYSPAPLGRGLRLFGGKNTSYGETGKPVLDGHTLASLAGRCFISAPRLPELEGNIIEGNMRAYWDCEDGIAELCDENPWHKATGPALKVAQSA